MAETIVEGIQRIDGTDITLNDAKRVDPHTIPRFDTIVIGSPNHLGGPTRGIKKFIDKLGSLSLEGTQFARV